VPRTPAARRLPPLEHLLAALAALLAFGVSSSARAVPPDEGDCPTVSALPVEGQKAVDATPIAIKEGMMLDKESLLMLRRLLPPEIWRQREAFFFEGMRMQVGYCHRRYLDASFYREATERFRGQSSLDAEGNLRGYTAGIPFPPDEIEPGAADAGLRWAWDMQMRYRGAGHRGHFRLVDMPVGLGRPLTYEGEFFFVQTANRADLAEQDYKVRDAQKMVFASGGTFSSPFDARGLAWRQFRVGESLGNYREPDDTFVYVPTMRKTRRAATNWTDGLFFPRYSASGDAGGGGMAIGSQLGGGFASINPTAGQSIAASENSARGFTGLAIRPNAYVWRVRGEIDVLAPINAGRPGWPIDGERNFGPSGLSVASDVWDVRHAVLLEGLMRVEDEDVKSILVYVDYQTRVPLYWITRTYRQRILEIGILVHRYSSDVEHHRDWPGGLPSNVFEPVAATFYNALEGGGGWRRESYDITSLPFDADDLRQMTSSDHLARGH